MKIIVAGGRAFSNVAVMAKCITNVFETNKLGTLELVCGMAKGADLTAYNLCNLNGMTIHTFKAEWDDLTVPNCKIGINSNNSEYNILAGFNRNHVMGDFAEGLIAFWDRNSPGTYDMITYMKKLNKPVWVFDYEGNPIDIETKSISSSKTHLINAINNQFC